MLYTSMGLTYLAGGLERMRVRLHCGEHRSTARAGLYLRDCVKSLQSSYMGLYPRNPKAQCRRDNWMLFFSFFFITLKPRVE